MANNHIKVFRPHTPEYNKLSRAAAILNAATEGRRYYVDDTYFDYGQDWKWTTILCERDGTKWGAYQALYPVDQERILNAENGADFIGAVKKVLGHY